MPIAAEDAQYHQRQDDEEEDTQAGYQPVVT